MIKKDVIKKMLRNGDYPPGGMSPRGFIRKCAREMDDIHPDLFEHFPEDVLEKTKKKQSK